MINIWPFNKQKKTQPIISTESTDPVVLDVKMKTAKAADEAKQKADKLNEIFEENGITLAIHIAAGGH